jgi:hypothetical protein
LGGVLEASRIGFGSLLPPTTLLVPTPIGFCRNRESFAEASHNSHYRRQSIRALLWSTPTLLATATATASATSVSSLPVGITHDAFRSIIRNQISHRPLLYYSGPVSTRWEEKRGMWNSGIWI